MENKDNFVQGLMIGGVVGVVLGLMLAPESGDKTRKEIVSKFHDLQDILTDKMSEFSGHEADKKKSKTSNKVVQKNVLRKTTSKKKK